MESNHGGEFVSILMARRGLAGPIAILAGCGDAVQLVAAFQGEPPSRSGGRTLVRFTGRGRSGPLAVPWDVR
jgi:hypothetical protein